MKKILVFILITFCCINLAISQDSTKIKLPKINKKNIDGLVLDIAHDMWQEAPDSFNIKGVSLAANVYLMKDIPLWKSNFSFAIGLGLGCHNVKSEAYPSVTGDSTVMNLLPKSFVSGTTNYTIDYKKNKLSTTYVDIPVELRFRTKPNAKNNSFKIAVGGKVGFLINSHTKYKGDNFTSGIVKIDEQIKIKEQNIKNIQDIRYGVMGRIGYGKFSVTGYYSLSTLFEEDKGPKLTPFSIGLSFSPF